ncbi:MAG: helix-turn-helix domain-containing protein [Candidatus Woesearchaeota archaeon]|jgi:sugar-specific transcriptional regulator TrmB
MEEALRELGLNEKESKLYLTLCKEKICNASHLAKLTKINRTTVYLELEHLLALGLVNYIIKNSKRYYQASPPEKLLQILDLKKEKIKSIIPGILALKGVEDSFKIEVYEGKEGLKTLYQDIMSTSKEILSFGVTGKAFEVLRFEFPHLVKKFTESGVKARYLANHDAKKLLDALPQKHVKIKYLPKQYDSKVSTIIYAEKVAIQSLTGDSIYVVVIKDKSLCEGYKSYFEFMWATLK